MNNNLTEAQKKTIWLNGQGEAAWETSKQVLCEAIYIFFNVGLARVKGKPMKQVKIDFMNDVVKIAFIAGFIAGGNKGHEFETTGREAV